MSVPGAVLDAWAIVAFLQGERAGEPVRPWVDRGSGLVSSINLGEALYVLTRSRGKRAARDRIARLHTRLHVEDPDWSIVTAAAAVKAVGGLSYADAFCVATAHRHALPLLTGDPEILALDTGLEVIDLRAAR